MLLVSVRKDDIEALDTTGIQVRINGEEVTLRRQGDRLLYGEEVITVFDRTEQYLEISGEHGLKPCVSFFAGEADTDYTIIKPVAL